MYSGMMDCARKTLAEEGLAGLYKGAASPLAGAAAHNAFLFLINGLAKSWLLSLKPPRAEGDPPHTLSVADQFAAGAIAGGFISIVETPIDLFKVKLQVQRGAKDAVGHEYSGVFDAAGKVFRAHGIRGWYQGVTATIARNVPAFSLYFGSFNWATKTLTAPDERPTVLTSFLAGSLAGGMFWAPIYPLEMVKTVMQSQPSEPAARKYASTIAATRGILADSGIAGFYRGYLPAVIRAVPVNGAIFAGFAFTKRILDGNSDDDMH